MKLRYGCAILVSVLAIQAGYGANESKIPTFDEVISNANVIIRPVGKNLSIKIGDDSYLIEADGSLEASNKGKNDVQVDQVRNYEFNVSILEGLINLRCGTRCVNESNLLWNVVLFNTEYDKKLAIQADYVYTLDVAAKNLVTNARKNWIRNLGYLVSNHLIELSKYIDLNCRYEGNYSTSRDTLEQELWKEGILNNTYLDMYNDEYFDEQGNPKRSGLCCNESAKIASDNVEIVDLESEVSGQVNVNRWISNKKVYFNVDPQPWNAAQIQIDYLDAPEALVNVPVEKDEQGKYLGKNDNDFVYFVVNQSVNPILFEDDIKKNIKNEIEEEEDSEEKNIDSAYIKKNIDSVHLDEDSTLAMLPTVLKSAILDILRKVHGNITDSAPTAGEQIFNNSTLIVKNKSYENMDVVLQKAPTPDDATENNGLFKCRLFNHQGQICDEELMRQIWNNSIQKLNADKKAEVFKSIQDEVSEEDLKRCHKHLLIRQIDVQFKSLSNSLNEPDMNDILNNIEAKKPGYKQSIGNLRVDDEIEPMSATETFLLDLLKEYLN